MTDIDIDKLETLRAAATQGPFVHVPPPQGYRTGYIGYYVEHEGRRLRGQFPANDADVAYPVEILNAAPALLAEVRRLRAIEAAARAYCDLTPERADETPAPLLFAKLQAALAAKENEK